MKRVFRIQGQGEVKSDKFRLEMSNPSIHFLLAAGLGTPTARRHHAGRAAAAVSCRPFRPMAGASQPCPSRASGRTTGMFTRE